jgi:hypothetical protein
VRRKGRGSISDPTWGNPLDLSLTPLDRKCQTELGDAVSSLVLEVAVHHPRQQA